MRSIQNCLLIILLLLVFSLANGFIGVPTSTTTQQQLTTSSVRFMVDDHSSATVVQVGDTVVVVDDVIKMGRNLKGLTGTVIETWEKCDVDPTCCCAEWVDEGLSVHVKFNVPSESTANNVDSLMAFNVPSESTAENADPLIANGIFVHYFAESELDKYNQSNDLAGAAPFDGLSCSKK